jgi:hypothetical protein
MTKTNCVPFALLPGLQASSSICNDKHGWAQRKPAQNQVMWFLLLVLCPLMMFLPAESCAQQVAKRKKFYGGLDMGAGRLHYYRNDTSETKTRLSTNFFGGYAPFRWLRTGINLGGWLIEASNLNNPEEGAAISNTHGQVQVFPFKEHGFFLTLQGGWSSYWNNHRGEYNAKGVSGKAGFGYESRPARGVGFTISANYGKGRFKDIHEPWVSVTNQHYDGFDVLLGIIFK